MMGAGPAFCRQVPAGAGRERSGQVSGPRGRAGSERSLLPQLPPAGVAQVTAASAASVPSRAVPARAVPCRAGPCRAVPCRTGPSRAVRCRAVRCRVVRCRAVPGRAVRCRARRSRRGRGPFGSAPTPPSGASAQRGPGGGRILRGALLCRRSLGCSAPCGFPRREEGHCGLIFTDGSIQTARDSCSSPSARESLKRRSMGWS
ncbi:uncharacterized protein LOC141727205 [Zonotrichia albicollis]|uniref:uncharacterized protein LOC141727205 n=1 Tax=Zonotrichia albicollis TaxID=44394 RepID=UPI003D81159D